MPRLDGTGPVDQGRKTGRGVRRCTGCFGCVMGGRKGTRKLDGKGPMGQGPRTGRGLGKCPSVK